MCCAGMRQCGGSWHGACNWVGGETQGKEERGISCRSSARSGFAALTHLFEPLTEGLLATCRRQAPGTALRMGTGKGAHSCVGGLSLQLSEERSNCV